MTESGRAIRVVYYDGAGLTGRPATAIPQDEGLLLAPDDGPTVLWPRDQLERLDGPAEAGLRIARHGQTGERIVIADPNDAAKLLAALPILGKPRASATERRRSIRWVAIGLAGMALIGLIAIEGLPRAFAYMPMSWTTGLGDDVRGQLGEFFDGDVCDDAEAQRALDSLAARLLADVPATARFDPDLVDIRLMDSDVPNAFAAPGGRIALFAGLFDMLDDDARGGGDALAGVLAHEIAHARLRHPSRSLGRNLGFELVAQSVGGGFGVNAGLMLAQLSYSRSAEEEADAMARAMLTAAGIGDAGLTAFFEKIASEGKGGDGGFFSTHPAPADRAEPGVVGPIPAFDAESWQAVRKACDS